MNCLICNQPMDEFHTSLNRKWHIDCEKCPICGEGPIDLDMLQKALDTGKSIGHTGCIESKLFKEIKDISMPLHMEHVDAINKEICTKWKVEPNIADYEYLRTCLIRLQEAAANVSMLMGETRGRLDVKSAQDYRNQTKEQREAEKLISRAKEQTKQISAERQAQLEAEKKNPVLKLRRKQIESFVKLGMSEESAEQAVCEIEAKGKANAN